MTNLKWVVDATETILDDARFNERSLMPVVAQDATSREVLMVAWMDREALRRTLSEGRVTYYSRSRQEYWRKGDTSGHTQHATSAVLDCDGDVILLQVHQVGPACHTGARSCFTARSES
jgi:phosphoribosyl-AMP cyclohydrolase